MFWTILIMTLMIFPVLWLTCVITACIMLIKGGGPYEYSKGWNPATSHEILKNKIGEKELCCVPSADAA